MLALAPEALESRALLTVFTVTTSIDEDLGAAELAAASNDGQGLSLREAIRLANENGGGTGQGQDDGDRIVFHPELAGSTVALTDRLQITDDLTIDGSAGTDNMRVTLHGSGAAELLDIATSGAAGMQTSVVLENLSMTGGRGSVGGAIANRTGSLLVIDNCELFGNAAQAGGAIASDTPMQITNSVIRDNEADTLGGGIYSSDDLTIHDTVVLNNSATNGGGLANSSLTDDVNITSTLFRDNRATSGGGIWISNAILEIADSLLERNTADIFGGAITMDSPNNTGRVTVSQSDLRSNSAGNAGGAIYATGTVTVRSRTTISGNSAEIGGGIVCNPSSEVNLGLVMSDSVVKNNTASLTGGGVEVRAPMQISNSTFTGNTAGTAGGAIVNLRGSASLPFTSTIASSTINNNRAGTNGGGIRAATVTLQIVNSTISGNSTTASGGGIGYDPSTDFIQPTSLHLLNCTIVENSTTGLGGGIRNHQSDVFDEPITVRNSIIANNQAPQGPDAFGLIGTAIQSLFEDVSGIVFTAIPQDLASGIDPMLGPLEDNGGSTFTHELLPDSIAIDHGRNSAAPGFDQTGAPRVVDGDGNGVATVDMGAYEFQNRPPIVTDSLDGLIFIEDVRERRFDLNDYFADPNFGDTLSYAIVFSNNPALLNASIDGSELVLNFKPHQNGEVRINITATDSAGAQVSHSPTFHVTAVNDRPVNSLPASVVVQEDVSTPITGMSITDVDAGEGLLEVALEVGHGTLTASDDVVGGLTPANIDGQGSNHVVLTGTLSQLNKTLADPAGLRYLGNANFNGSDALSVFTNDGGNSGAGGALTDTDTVAITVQAVNDAPVIILPGEYTGYEDVPLAIGVIFVADVDASEGTGLLRVTLAADQGTLSVAEAVPGGLAAGDINGNGTASVTLTGTQAAINATLAADGGLVYLGNVDFHGTDALTLTTDDLGNTGTPGALQDSDSVSIRLLSAEEQIERVEESIDQLTSDGALNHGKAQSILAKLSASNAALERGQPNAAVNMLGTLLNHVDALHRARKLDDAQATELTEAISTIMLGISIHSQPEPGPAVDAAIVAMDGLFDEITIEELLPSLGDIV